MKAAAIVFAVVIVILLGILVFVQPAKSPTVTQLTVTSSTSGSHGGNDTGSVQGKVVLGPTCPVESIPPNPQCAPRPYQTSIAISRNIETPQSFETIKSDSSGAFSVSLSPGEYLFYAQGGSPYPRCNEQLVTVTAGQTSSVTIMCDTGIR
jgi:hypothetical protein